MFFTIDDTILMRKDEKRADRQAVVKSDDTAKKIDNTVIIVLANFCCLGVHFYEGYLRYEYLILYFWLSLSLQFVR